MEERDVETDSVADLQVAISEEESGESYVEDDVVGAGIAESIKTLIAGTMKHYQQADWGGISDAREHYEHTT